VLTYSIGALILSNQVLQQLLPVCWNDA